MLYDPENSSLTPLAYETIMGGMVKPEKGVRDESVAVLEWLQNAHGAHSLWRGVGHGGYGCAGRGAGEVLREYFSGDWGES